MKNDFINKEEIIERLIGLFQFNALGRFFERGIYSVKELQNFRPKKYLDDNELKEWNKNIKLLKRLEVKEDKE